MTNKRRSRKLGYIVAKRAYIQTKHEKNSLPGIVFNSETAFVVFPGL